MPDRALPLLVFDLADRRCALPAASIAEILPLPRLERPPGCPDALAGFLTLAGTTLPVLALARVLGLPPTAPDAIEAHVLVPKAGTLRLGERPLCLLVDRAADVVSVMRDAVRPVAATDALADCIVGTVVSVGRLVHVLDPDRVVSAEERAILADLAARETARRAAFVVPGR